MTLPGDDLSDMRRNLARNDRDVESVLRGRHPAERPDLEPLAVLVDDLRLMTAAPARPNAALAAVLAAGLPAPDESAVFNPVTKVRRRAAAVRWMSAVRWSFSSLRTAAKAGVIALVAVLGIATAATAGALPAPIQAKVSDAVETVTPWHIPHPAGHGIGPEVREKARHHGKDKDKDKGAAKTEPSPTHAAGDDNSKSDNVVPESAAVPAPTETRKAERPGKSEKSSEPARSLEPGKSEPNAKGTHPSEPSHRAEPSHGAEPSHRAEPSHPAKREHPANADKPKNSPQPPKTNHADVPTVTPKHQ
jgi:hypothetical protein